MHLDEIQDQCDSDSVGYFPDIPRDLNYLALALCGEVGELANELKKFYRTGSSSHLEAASTELPDILIYLLLVTDAMGFDLETLYIEKREFNNERYRHTEEADA